MKYYENTVRCFTASVLALIIIGGIALVLPGQVLAIDDKCLDASYSGNNTPACVANDVRISVVTVPDPITCTIGQVLDVNLKATLVSGAVTRYDVGIYLARGNYDAKTGPTCFRDTLTPLAPPLNLTGGSGGYRNVDGDACGDILEADGNNVKNINNYSYTCRDGNNDGQADIGSCLAWDNNDNTTCGGVLNAIPGTGSKCRCELLPLGNVYIAGKIIVDKNTVPTGSSQSFEFHPSWGSNFNLTHAATPHDSGNLLPTANGGGIYSVAEVGPPAGWQKTSATCTGAGGASKDPAAITLLSGETVTCTFVNTEICPSSHSCSSFDSACGTKSCNPAGAPNNCDVQNYASATTECRASAGICDVAESCTGSSAACPSDGFVAATTECRAQNGVCDVAESCTGSSGACPTDGFVAATTECRAQNGVCDVAESCTGSSGACPSDGFVAATTECRAKNGVCDVAESCTGSNGSCPGDAFAAATTVCDASARSACDPDEYCTGTNAICPEGDDTATCSTAEGCSPGFWKNHTSLWDGSGGNDVTSNIFTGTTWASLNIPTCDGKALTGALATIGQSISAPNKHSTNTLFHLSACLVSSDALDGFPFNDVNALVQQIKDACAAGGQTLTDLKNACAAANNHDEITIFCPLD